MDLEAATLDNFYGISFLLALGLLVLKSECVCVCMFEWLIDSYVEIAVVCTTRRWRWALREWSFWWRLIQGVICSGFHVNVQNVQLMIRLISLYVDFLVLLIFSSPGFVNLFVMELCVLSEELHLCHVKLFPLLKNGLMLGSLQKISKFWTGRFLILFFFFKSRCWLLWFLYSFP